MGGFDWKAAVGTIAPGLAAVLGGPLAGGAVKVLADALLGGSSGDQVADEAKLAGLLAGGITPELRAKILEAEQQIKLAVVDLLKTEQAAITGRWQADMASDSWLAKNVRPAVLIYILTAYTALALLSGAEFNVAPAYVELLGQWGMLVMTAYFGGRSAEKIFAILREGGRSGGR